MGELTPREREFLFRLHINMPLRMADREEDRARQSCRRAGLAVVLRQPRRWKITDKGREAISKSSGAA